MANASILFTTPVEMERLGLALEEAGATSEDLPGIDDHPLSQLLAEVTPGTSLSIDFEADEPIHGVLDAASALEAEGVSYWGHFDAFVERSRGLRVLGRVIVNLTGAPADRVELEIPWTHGSPSFDERTLRAAGVDPKLVDEIVGRFFSPAADQPQP